MRELRLKESHIRFGEGSTREVGETARDLIGGTRAFVLTDTHCEKIAKTVRRSLKEAGYRVAMKSITPGEKKKSLSTANTLYPVLLDAGLDRSSVFLTVGGGVITDLGGFVASTYMRGIPLIHVPTTLLAQVDAAIGGKTAVNLSHGKNLVGTFYQPKAIQIDIENLTSLPQRELVGGVAEVIKSAMIRSKTFFSFLKKNAADILKRDATLLDEIIYRTGKIKAEVVTVDEKESGLRAILNYGHTIGHGLETASRYRGFHHGEAVSIGMEAAAQMSWTMGFIKGEVVEKQRELLHAFGLPTKTNRVSKKKVLRAITFDKKAQEGRPKFVLPEAIGQVRHGILVPPPILDKAVQAVTS